MDIRIRETEGAVDQPYLLWDSYWNNDPLADAVVDWKKAGPNEPNNAYGLASLRGLDTAILLCLFTWRRAEDSDVLPAGTDPKGWWGDAVDLEDNEGPLGSRLWLLARAPLNATTQQLAVDYANEALQPLVDQGAVASFDCTATIDKVNGYLVLAVQAFSQSGQLIYDQKFERIWQQEFP